MRPFGSLVNSYAGERKDSRMCSDTPMSISPVLSFRHDHQPPTSGAHLRGRAFGCWMQYGAEAAENQAGLFWLGQSRRKTTRRAPTGENVGRTSALPTLASDYQETTSGLRSTVWNDGCHHHRSPRAGSLQRWHRCSVCTEWEPGRQWRKHLQTDGPMIDSIDL